MKTKVRCIDCKLHQDGKCTLKGLDVKPESERNCKLFAKKL